MYKYFSCNLIPLSLTTPKSLTFHDKVEFTWDMLLSIFHIIKLLAHKVLELYHSHSCILAYSVTVD